MYLILIFCVSTRNKQYFSTSLIFPFIYLQFNWMKSMEALSEITTGMANIQNFPINLETIRVRWIFCSALTLDQTYSEIVLKAKLQCATGVIMSRKKWGYYLLGFIVLCKAGNNFRNYWSFFIISCDGLGTNPETVIPVKELPGGTKPKK